MKTPKFENLKDERNFWDKQDSTDYLDDFEEAGNVVFARSKKDVISLRLEPKISNKLKEIIGYRIIRNMNSGDTILNYSLRAKYPG